MHDTHVQFIIRQWYWVISIFIKDVNATLAGICFIQSSKFLTHIHGEILDLLPDNDSSANPALWILTPFSDHFLVLADI